MIETWQRIHYAIAALSFPKLFAIGVSGGGALGVFLGEIITNQWGAAGLSGVIASVFMTVALVVPRVMEQKRKGRESESTISSKLFNQQAQFYERRLLILNDIVRYYQIVAAQRDLIATYERNSKHAMLTELNSADLRIREYEHEAAAAGKNIREYRLRTYTEISGDNDRKVEAAKNRISEAIPVATSPSTAAIEDEVIKP